MSQTKIIDKLVGCECVWSQRTFEGEWSEILENTGVHFTGTGGWILFDYTSHPCPMYQ